MLLFIDNYDSFTFNLVQALEVLGANVVVVRNNVKSVDECLELRPSSIVIGPGPGTPQDAGISNAIIKRCEGTLPILGVCLGHQCIAEVYGCKVIRAQSGPMHGKTSKIRHQNTGIFANLPPNFSATRYHSLAVDNNTLPECLSITARSDDGEIMGLRHLKYSIEGLQFHPESILTKSGPKLLNNFLNLSKIKD